jgi:hypothetical protein
VTSSRSLVAAIAAALSLATPASAWAAHLLDKPEKPDNAHQHDPAATPTSTPTAATPTPTPTPAPASDDEGKGKGKAKGKDKPKKDKPNQDNGGDAQGDQGGDAGAPAPAAPVLPPQAAPVAGEHVAAAPAAGDVRVKLPGTDTFLPLDQAASMPVGTRIDARAGTVVLHAALPGVGAEAGTFSGAQFVVRQDTRHRVTELRLIGGDFGKCADRSLAAAHRRKKVVVRGLWSSDHGGHFRTHGHNSVATVRGTRWLTEDRCDGTLTKVTRGVVSVYDRRAHRTVVVKAGHSYLARRHP